MSRQGGKQETFQPMELPVLPLDQELLCTDMLHHKFDTETGPLWRVQIITRDTFQKAGPAMGFGPEVEAIIEANNTVIQGHEKTIQAQKAEAAEKDKKMTELETVSV